MCVYVCVCVLFLNDRFWYIKICFENKRTQNIFVVHLWLGAVYKLKMLGSQSGKSQSFTV